MRGHCILSHGFESGPDATKVTALADVAERLGWTHERPDYTDLDARREVTLQVSVDPAVLGGAQVTLGDELIEGTVAGRLRDAHRLIG